MNRKLLILLVSISLVGNAQWQKINLNTQASFRSIDAVSEKVVWAGGSNGTVLKTIDGGQNWEVIQVKGAEKLDFRGIEGFDEKTAILMSAGEAEKGAGKIYKTTDGGKNWEIIFETQQKGVFFDSINFWNEKTGLLLSDPIDENPSIYKTTDGGKTWDRIGKEKLPTIKKGESSFAASGNCIAVVGNRFAWVNTQSRVFYTKNKGKTWKVAETPFPQGETSGIFGLHFWNKKSGIAVGGDFKNDKRVTNNIAISTTGGEKWGYLTQATPDGLKESGFLLENKDLILVGTSGTSLSKDYGKSWKSVDNESFHAISCAGNTCFAVGGKGNLGKWEQ